MIVIPAIDIMKGKVVRLQKGNPAHKTIYGNDISEFVTRWSEQGADMLHIVDLDATLGHGSNRDTINEIASEVPLEIAGGLRDADTAIQAAGVANRIVIGTMAFANRDSLLRVRDTIGVSRTVVSLDHRAGRIATRGWTDTADVSLEDALDSLISDGISEFMITDIERDGMMQGTETDMLRAACTRKANIIASGGVSSMQDVAAAKKCGAYGVILGRAIYDGDLSVSEVKRTC